MKWESIFCSLVSEGGMFLFLILGNSMVVSAYKDRKPGFVSWISPQLCDQLYIS